MREFEAVLHGCELFGKMKKRLKALIGEEYFPEEEQRSADGVEQVGDADADG